MKQVRVRRWMAVAVVAAVVALPSAAWVVGSRVHETADTTDETAQLARQVQALALRTSHDAQVTTAALCALRSDLEQRVASSEAFLRRHPHGILGISAKDIRTGIVNQQRTILALSGIDCPR
jgi:hypothetical protein